MIDTIKPNMNAGKSPKFLRWAGSKTHIIPKFIELVPAFNNYHEPFCGSCALFFSLSPRRATLSDANPALITTLRAVRDFPNLVYERLLHLEWSEASYYQIRDQGIQDSDEINLATKFIFLNANCFNGIFRLNRAGKFNVPYGGHRAGRCPSLERLTEASRLLKNAEIVCGDFEEIVSARAAAGDLVYLDPPFAIRNTRIFHQYRYDDFGVADVTRLQRMMHKLDKDGVAFIVSYAASEEADELSKGWQRLEATRPGNIAGFKGNRKLAREVIITNA